MLNFFCLLHLFKNVNSYRVIQDKLKFGGHLGFWTLISAKTTKLFLADTQFWIAHTSRFKKKWVSTNAQGGGRVLVAGPGSSGKVSEFQAVSLQYKIVYNHLISPSLEFQ